MKTLTRIVAGAAVALSMTQQPKLMQISAVKLLNGQFRSQKPEVPQNGQISLPTSVRKSAGQPDCLW